MEAGMLCMINIETFFSFMKNMWIRDWRASCHVTNDNTHDIIDINELVKVNSGSMFATKKENCKRKYVMLAVTSSTFYC